MTIYKDYCVILGSPKTSIQWFEWDLNSGRRHATCLFRKYIELTLENFVQIHSVFRTGLEPNYQNTDS